MPSRSRNQHLSGVAPKPLRQALLNCTLLLLLGLCTIAQAAQPVRISLIAINDFHGHLLPPPGTVPMPDAANGRDTRVAAGGAAYVSTLVRQLKDRNPGHTLVVGAGDLVGASPLASGLFHDEPTIEVLNQIGLDISSVGNHEFDKGRAELLRLQSGGCRPRSADGKSGVVGVDTCMNGGAFSGAKFQYLAANVLVNGTGNTLLPATALREVGGVKIGFIGLTLRSTPAMVMPQGVIGLQFLGEVSTVNRLAPLLKAQGAAAVVVLLHQGAQTTASTAQDKTCPGLTGPAVALADQFDSAVDVVISGHTHQEYVCLRPDGKLLTQAGSNGRLLTLLELQVDPIANAVVAKDANNWVVQTSALQPDPAVEAIVRRYADLTGAVSAREVGRMSAPLVRRQNAAGESSLGAVVADAFLAASSGSGNGQRPAQIALTNPGGLRSDLREGVVTFGQLYSVLPFNNQLISMDLTGRQILRLLEQQWERPQAAEGRMLAVSNGFSYAWDAGKSERATPGIGRRVVPGSMRLHGAPMAMDKLYRVVVNDFMVSSGGRSNVLKNGLNMYQGEGDLRAFEQYLQRESELPPPRLGRIARIN